jgi:hypothetical protein
MRLRQSGGKIGLLAVSHRAPANLIADAVALSFCFAVSINPVSAQTISEFAKDTDPLFQRLLANPANLDNTLNYAVAVAKSDDVEAAIGTYEQLLFYNPNLSRIRFELGVLYYRLGSYATARGYFKSALRMQDITAEMRAKAEEFIAAIDKKLQPDQFSGFAQTGVRYQTNPAAGPSQQTVLASGYTFNSRFLAHPDWNWFGAFGVNYVHDFETQNGDTFEASVLGYDAQQFTEHQFDLGLLELRAGPRFGLVSDDSYNVSIKPYGVGTGSLLADAPYSVGGGGGATVHVGLGSLALDPFVEIVQQSFSNSSLYPLASQLTGPLSTYAFQAAAPIYGGLGWQARVAYSHDQTVFEPYSYNEYSADIWLPWNFSFPGDSRTWTLTPTAGVSNWLYKAPDPTIDPTTAERNLEWRVGLGLDFPIRGQFIFGVLVQYRDVLSNIPVFAMRDLSVTFGPSLKF